MEGDNYEYNTLMEGIKYAVEEVRGSGLYKNLVDQIDQAKVPDEIITVSNYLGGHAMPMVIYGLGSIQYSYAARFQLAFAALLLREVAGLKIDRDRVTICCDDITLNPVEEKAFKAHGCKVVVIPEGRRFRWMVDEPTLFFLPFTRIEVLGDLLETNWCPSRLKRMMILGRSLRSMARILDTMVSTSTYDGRRSKMTVRKLTYARDRLRYIWGIKEHSREFEIGDIISPIDKSQPGNYSPQEMFENMCWHVFSFDENTNTTIEDMDSLLPSTEICFKWVDEDTSYPYRMDEEDAEDLLQLQHEMEIAMLELRDSEHYHKLRNQLEVDNLLKNEFSRRIGSEKQVQMVIYALGSLVHGFRSHYQLALALLLREEVEILRIGEIQVFDPRLTPADVKLIRSFGCNVLSANEFGRRRVGKPTLFFMPFACWDLVANLLEANWSSSMLDNLMILGTSMHEWVEESSPNVISLPVTSEIERLTSDERLRYMHTIKDWSIKFAIDEGHKFSPFSQLYWVFFNLDAGIDINSLLPSFSTLDKIRVDHSDAKSIPDDWISVDREASERIYSKYFKPNPKWKQRFSSGSMRRQPREYRKTWRRPPQGWIKLNFDGYGPYGRPAGSTNYGYGGILYNDEGKPILSYMGPVLSEVKRIEAAQVEGLKEGIRCFKQWLPNSSCSDDPKLIIEGSALNVITWAKAFIPPPQRFREAFEEMTIMLGDINCGVYYIHEEANNKANELAKLGITLSKLSLIMCRE